MSEESTTHDLPETTRRFVEAANRRDFAAMMSFFAPNAVYESRMGALAFEDLAAIRGFFEDWLGFYEEFAFEIEEDVDLGNGVTFGVFLMKGRPSGSSGEVRARYGAVTVWLEGLAVRVTSYPDVDEARAAAERLAESRE